MSGISVEQLRSSIAAALALVRESEAAVTAASEKLSAARAALAAATHGSNHQGVTGSQAALAHAEQTLEETMAATQSATEQAETYAATL